MPHPLNIFRRLRISRSSAPTSKPPSVFQYTLILLKARPTPRDLDRLDEYARSRAAAIEEEVESWVVTNSGRG
jgi:hypothetical protein